MKTPKYVKSVQSSKVHNKETRKNVIDVILVSFIVNFEQISHIVLMFSWLTLKNCMLAGNLVTIKKKIYDPLVALSMYGHPWSMQVSRQNY